VRRRDLSLFEAWYLKPWCDTWETTLGAASSLLSHSPLFETKITLPSAYFNSKSLFRHTKSISRPLELVSRTKQGREFVGDFIRLARRLLEETVKVLTRPYGRRPLE